jgi:hypothetical protein
LEHGVNKSYQDKKANDAIEFEHLDPQLFQFAARRQVLFNPSRLHYFLKRKLTNKTTIRNAAMIAVVPCALRLIPQRMSSSLSMARLSFKKLEEPALL